MSYAQPPSVQQVIQDAGGLLIKQNLSSKEGARNLNQDTALTVISKDHGILILQDLIIGFEVFQEGLEESHP